MLLFFFGGVIRSSPDPQNKAWFLSYILVKKGCPFSLGERNSHKNICYESTRGNNYTNPRLEIMNSTILYSWLLAVTSFYVNLEAHFGMFKIMLLKCYGKFSTAGIILGSV